MFDFFSTLVSSKKLKFDKGEVKLLGTNMCLIPPEVYVEMLVGLEKDSEEDLLYTLSKESGKKWFSELLNFSPVKTKQEGCDFVKKILNILAVGKVEIVSADIVNCTAVVQLHNSLMPDLCGKRTAPVDLQFSGYLAGAFSLVFEKDVSCKELKCKAVNADFCEFIVS